MNPPPGVRQYINKKLYRARSSKDDSGGKYPAMQCHKDGCGSFAIRSGPFKMLYHG